MKTNVYLGIALRIIILFTVGSLMTFLPEILRPFFGDTKFIPEVHGMWTKTEIGSIDTAWNWGARHYWYFWMMVILFLLSAANTIISIANLLIKNYPETFK